MSQRTAMTLLFGMTHVLTFFSVFFWVIWNPLEEQLLHSVLVATEIFILEQLFLYTVFTLLQSGVNNKSVLSVLKSFAIWSMVAVVFHVISVLYGAPAITTVSATFHFGCLLSTLTVLPCCFVLGISTEKWAKTFFLNSPDPGLESVVHITTFSTLIGAWLGAFPIPLDWDRPWQEWPISCIVGAVCGHLLGLAVATVHCLYSKDMHNTKSKGKHV